MEEYRTGFDVNCTCRCCLSSCVEVESIINSVLEEQIWECTSVRIMADDGLPTGLCPSCRSDLCVALSFRTRCLQSDAILRQISNNYGPNEIEFKNVSRSSFSEPSTPQEFPDPQIKVEVDIKCEEDAPFNWSGAGSGAQTDWSADARSNRGTSIDRSARSDRGGDTHSNINANSKSDLQNAILGRKEKKYTCNICSKPLSTKGSLQKHKKNLHGTHRKSSSTGEQVTVGTVTGWGSSRRFNCTVCDYSCPRQRELIYHMRTHTGEKPLECDICQMRFAQPSNLFAHKKTHSDKMYFTCDQCGKQFKHNYQYKKHMIVHTMVKKYICDTCNKPLKSRDAIINHLKRHYNIRKFSCDKCGALFVTKGELMNHSKKHTGEKKYSCNFCEFKCTFKMGLESHVMRHMGERPFKCDLCEKSCYTKYALKIHMKKHTKERNYACPVCEMKFSYSSVVNRHMLKIHNMKYNRLNIVDRRTVK